MTRHGMDAGEPRIARPGAPRTDGVHEWLAGCRLLLERAWSAETAHPSYAAGGGGAGPRGQCGASSAWLAAQLRFRYGIESAYCYGRLQPDVSGVGPVDHRCWLEIGPPYAPRLLVIDITSDQAPGLGRNVICEPGDLLERYGLRYIANSRRTPDDLGSDSAWPRYLLLSEAVTKNTGDWHPGAPGTATALKSVAQINPRCKYNLRHHCVH